MNIDKNSTKKHILDLLADPSNQAISQNQLSKILGVDQSTVSQHLKELEEAGLIDIDRSPNLNDLKELTLSGYQAREKAGGTSRPMPDEEEGPISLHKRFVKFKISNSQDFDDVDWIERWASDREVRHRYDHTNDSYMVYVDEYRFRVTNEAVFVVLPEIRGYNANHLKNQTMAQAFDAVDYLENRTPLELVSKPEELEIWMNQQHISYIGHPLAQVVDSIEGLSLSDVKVYDESGKERLKMDASHGPELESELPGFEDDIQHEIDRLKDQCENPEKHRRLYEDVPREIDELQEKIQRLEAQLESSEKSIEDHLTITSKWIDQWGNLMGYAEELGHQVMLVED